MEFTACAPAPRVAEKTAIAITNMGIYAFSGKVKLMYPVRPTHPLALLF